MAKTTIQEKFDLAVRHHQAGQWREAERLYRQVLARQPQHAGATHLLGAIAHQAGRDDLAVELIRRAMTFKPNWPEAYNNLGIALLGMERREEAIAAFRQAIALNRNWPEVHNKLGIALADMRRLEEAVAAFRQAIALRSDYAEAYSNLGSALAAAGQREEAIAAFRQAIALRSDYAQAYSNLGSALAAAGQLEEAIAAFGQAVALNPHDAKGCNNFGRALGANGRLDEAIAAYRQAIALKPDYLEPHNNLGVALGENGQVEEAIAAFRQAIALSPDCIEAHNNLGAALEENGQVEEAIAAFRQAIALQPAHVETHNNLGAALERAGDLAGAEQCYRQAIELDKNEAIAHAKLATLLGRRLPEKDLISLQELLADPSGDASKQIALHFAAAQVLDARDNFSQAAEHLRVGHGLCLAEAAREGKSYDVAAHAQWVSRMIAACSEDFFQRVRGMGVASRRPVFIIGLPRSGTTLVEQILAAHSQVFGAGELELARHDFYSLAGKSAPTVGLNARMDLAFQRLARLDQAKLQEVASRHLLELDKLNGSAARIVDKMPENYLRLGLLTALFPQAAIIHCRRDWRDVAVSCWITQLSAVPWSNDLEHIVTRFEQYRRLMQHWANVLPGRWLDCDYEQTVADLPGTARRLVEWCGLEWEPACVDFHLVKRAIHTASLTQVRQPIYNRSVGRWKNYRELLAPVLARLS